MKLSSLSIARPVATLVLALAVAVLGVFSLVQLPVNLLPDITYPLVKVYVTWRGATPEEVEDSIATLIERRMATVDGLDYLESQCTEGMYSLSVNFSYDVDRDIAYQDVLAKMGLVRKNLPSDAEEPQIIKADPSQLPVMDLMVSSKQMDLTRLRTWVENSLQDRFTAIPGTAGSEISGGRIREIRVLLDPERLLHYRLPASVVAQRLRDENLEILAGRVTAGRQEFAARTTAEFQSLDEIRATPVTTDRQGNVVYVRDLAQVEDSYRVQRVMTRLAGVEGVKLSIFKQAGANTVAVEEGVRRRLDEIKGDLPADVKIGVIYDQADYIRASLAGVRDAALTAAILVVLVSAFFLVGWRRVLVVAITLPVSLLATSFVMKYAGFSLNIFSLGGLIVSITVLLDNCVVVVENITRVQAEDSDEKEPVVRGAVEVTGAVTVATVTFLALFLPFLLVSGLTSLLFRELVLVVATAIVASLAVSVTLAPTLMKLLFPGTRRTVVVGPVARMSEALMAGLFKRYEPVLAWSLRWRGTVLLITAALFALGMVMLQRIGSEFLPEMEDGQIIIKLKMPTGTAVDETASVIEKIEAAVKDVSGVERYSALVGGRALGLVTTEAPNEGEVNLQLVPRAKRVLTTPQFVQKLSATIGQNVKTPGARIKVMHSKVKGIRSVGDFDVEAEVYGPREMPIEDLARTAQSLMGEVRGVPGLANADISLDVTKPEYQIVVDRQRAAAYGLSASQVAGGVRSMVDGLVTTAYKDEGYTYDIRALLSEEQLTGIQDLTELILAGPGGSPLRLRDVAQVVPGIGPVQVDRKNQLRVLKVTGMAEGRPVGDVNRDVAAVMARAELPPSVFIRYGGQAATIAQEFRSLALILTMALFLSYVILAVQFESWSIPFIVMARVPLTLVGLTMALWLTGTPIGVTVMIGIIILAGIEVNHGVLLLAVIGQRRADGDTVAEAIHTATRLRLRPILMTAFVGVVGLLPLALAIGDGTETLRPMAIAVIGGLLFSLFLTFVFMPALYSLMEGSRRPEATPADGVQSQPD